jgi:hypothetical protein
MRVMEMMMDCCVEHIGLSNSDASGFVRLEQE